MSSEFARLSAIRTINDFLSGKIDVVSASRRLSDLGHSLEMRTDESLVVFAAIDSDTDDLPTHFRNDDPSSAPPGQDFDELVLYLESVDSIARAAGRDLLKKLDAKEWTEYSARRPVV